MRCAIWYHLYNLKNVKNTHVGVLILAKLQASSLISTTESYITGTNNIKNRKRKSRKFNPLYSLNVSANIGKKFFRLLDESFPKAHKLHKLFNCNNVKSSYSSLPNCKTVINNHDKNILHEPEKHFLCNYREEAICPLNGSCQHENLWITL